MTNDTQHASDVDLKAITEKVKKLMRKARSAEAIGSQAEAEAFAAKAQELLLRHKLSLGNVDLDALEDADPIIEADVDPSTIGTRRKKTRVRGKSRWVGQLANVVAHAYFCRVYTYTCSANVAFIGRTSDREVAVDVFTRLVAFAADASYDAYCKLFYANGASGVGANFNAEFHRGFRFALAERFAAIRAAATPTSDERALIVLHDKAVDAYYGNLKLRKARPRKMRQGPERRADRGLRGR